MKHITLPKPIIIESGDWCKKYKKWIEDDIVKKCKLAKKKGCYYCKYRSYEVKITR